MTVIPSFIWKFVLTPTGDTVMDVPRHAKVLALQVQNDTPCLWMLCMRDNLPERRRFTVVPTGFSFNGVRPYIGSFQLADGFVGHVFELDL